MSFTREQVVANNARVAAGAFRAEQRRLNPIAFSHDNPTRHPASSPEPQQAVRDEPLAADARKESHPGRVSVRVVSYRRRLIDPDNLCPKFHIDACRYAGFIKDDSAKEIEYSIRQEQVPTKDLERTEITIETP
jgi:hypothetical protein